MLRGPFNKAVPIIQKIESHNHKAYFVGGCVRDLLLNRSIGDVDITTSAPPEVIQTIFEKVIPVGIKHGTVVVVHEDIPYEVTTFRTEGVYSDSRHPDTVTFIDDIDKDLERRDFTINALAMDLAGNIIDLFDGKEDLKKGIIRTVGDGNERFKEDPLRIIRALRFSSQLGFEIYSETIQQMKAVQSEIESLAVERITNEFEKLFAGKYVKNGLEYINIIGTYQFLPIFKDNPSLFSKIPKTIQPLASFGEVIALLHLLENNISISEWVKSWKCSNQVKKDAKVLVESYNYYETNGIDEWLVYTLDNRYYEGFSRIVNSIHQENTNHKDLHHMNKQLPIHSRKELAVNGSDIANIFPLLQKGPWLQKMLTDIEKAVVFRELANSKSDIKEWIKCNPPEAN
ncbi:CCA tRNA nucleotidyltransferase [Oceanobacillus halophilus]|uniref:CCA-adding enzyme n=1 Tax=Oceanobacillus halophilus TaxID=930130 RepID=A0A495ACP7_9BACI|nr:CCA tRNA nucleotidyltransferase [Oceanobacillus halophilus]RKQ37642.1 CCA tRNA nucleotidyltransferase [Oceanobacillus halophilus]